MGRKKFGRNEFLEQVIELVTETTNLAASERETLGKQLEQIKASRNFDLAKIIEEVKNAVRPYQDRLDDRKGYFQILQNISQIALKDKFDQGAKIDKFVSKAPDRRYKENPEPPVTFYDRLDNKDISERNYVDGFKP